MSDLLREAIVDANMLREVALKNAETAIIEKYSDEVRHTLDQILEQDELSLDMGGEMGPDAAGAPEAGLDPAGDPTADAMADPMGAPEEGAVEDIDEEGNIPLAATDDFGSLEGKNLKGFPAAGEEVELSIDLGALQEAIENMNNNSEIDINEEELEALLAEDDEDDDPSSQTWQVQPGEKEDPSAEEEEADSQAMQRSGLEEVGGVVPARAERRTPHGTGQRVGDEKKKKEDEEEEEEGLEELAQARQPGPRRTPHGTGQRVEDEKKKEDAKKKEDDPLDEIVDAIMEKLTVDMGADLSGWAGRSSQDMKWELEKALAHRRSTDVEEDLKVLKKAHEELVFENNQLSEQNTQYKQAFQELKENLQDVNLSNARLLYTNRVLRSASLNERQKTKIVEAISSAGSVTEARMIYETLQSTVEATPVRTSRPQSLSEAISRRSSVIHATRQESSSQDPYADRMKKLAGII